MKETERGSKRQRENTLCDVEKDEKTAFDNKWVSTGLKPNEDKRDRRDGPGGERGTR